MPDPIRFTLNGQPVRSASPPMSRLSDVLRHELAATGTKSGCDAGDCGACSVLIDGEVSCACLVPVAQAEGTRIVTVEGLPAHTYERRACAICSRHTEKPGCYC